MSCALVNPQFVPGRLTEARAARLNSKYVRSGAGDEPQPQHGFPIGAAPSPPTKALVNCKLSRSTRFSPNCTTAVRVAELLRSLSSTLVRDLDYQRGQMRSLPRDQSCRYPLRRSAEVDVPDVLGGMSYRQLRDDDIERIALDLRRRLAGGRRTCPDIVALLERAGIVVSVIEIGTSSWMACAVGRQKTVAHIFCSPVIKMSFPRRTDGCCP